MIDIVSTGSGELQAFDTQVNRAANLLSVQLGALEYAPEVGIDLNYFLSDQFKFEDAAFYSYLVQVLASFGINVATVMSAVQNLYQSLKLNLSPEETSTSLMAR